MLSELSWWRAMPIGVSCLLHVGLVTGLILGRTLSPIRVLSTAIKAYAPDITFAPDGSFLVAWHEEQFPFLKTVVQPVRIPKARWARSYCRGPAGT